MFFNQAIELATWQQIKQYDNSVAGAYKIVEANGNIINRFFAWLIQFTLGIPKLQFLNSSIR
jgi:hypothetical protein